MIEFHHGDILEADAEALVNTVNCVGVMGRGIALQFRKAFPDNFKAYKAACDRGQVRVGKMLVHERTDARWPRYIINFPTKGHWRSKSRIEDIEAGLDGLVQEIRKRSIRSIALPPLGCGLGGLDWQVVRPLIENSLESLRDLRALVYEPTGAPPPERMARDSSRPAMTVGRAAVIGLIRRYLAGAMDAAVTLLEIHKLVYFLQEAGEPLRLEYQKGKYGPYADNLRHVLSRMEGHFISGYGDAGDWPDKQISLMPDAVDQAETFLRAHGDTLEKFGKVAGLIDGFESAFGLELLATVHWAATREGGSTAEEVGERVYAWNTRKRMFEPRHIRIAWNVLEDQGWLVHAR